jgi:hypothetical protein
MAARKTGAKSPAKIPHRNRKHTGWWLARFIERFEYDDENKRNLKRRCLAWENTVLIQAKDREQAFRKAVVRARLVEGLESWDAGSSRKGAWRFEGLTSLLPIYEELADGAEIVWTEHAGKSVETIRRRVKKKRELEAFDDTKR